MILLVHLTTLIATGLVVLWADHRAFLYMWGKHTVLDKHELLWLHRLVWLGLSLMIGSGLFLFWPERAYLLADPAFYLKMILVAVLIINAGVIEEFFHMATTVPFGELNDRTKMILVVSGGLSFISWVGAATIGLFFL